MKHKILLVFIVILNVICLSDQFKKTEKKIDITHIETKYNEDSSIKINLQMTKFNRTHSAVNANATVTDVIDDKYRFQLELRLWSDGGWKRNYVTYGNKDPCVQLKYTIGKTWNDVIKAAKANYKCPYYAGYFELKDYFVDVGNVPVLFAVGTFKLLIQVFKGNKFIIMLIVDLEIRDLI